MAIPEGAHYVRGTLNRRVRLADGSVVSRAAAENLRAQTLTGGRFRTNYQLRKAVRQAKDEGLFATTKWRDHEARARSAALRRGETYRSADVRSLAATVRGIPRDDRGRPTGPETQPGGSLDRYLTAIGRREPGTDWAVGETPSAHK